MNNNPKAMNTDLYYNVVQANELIRSKQDELTLLEAKLLRLTISQILENDTDMITYKCSLSELSKALQIPKSNISLEINNITTSLMRKVITIKGKELDNKGKYPWKKFHWVDTVYYNNGELTIKLSDDLKPYLIGLNEMFTSYNYSNIVALPTVYSIRLCELIISYISMTRDNTSRRKYNDIVLNAREMAFSIEYLRNFFNCEDKYTNNGDFIKRVISPSVKAIADKLSIWNLDYRLIKKGNKITDVVFFQKGVAEIQ